jgi:hypothetical protein
MIVHEGAELQTALDKLDKRWPAEPPNFSQRGFAVY